MIISRSSQILQFISPLSLRKTFQKFSTTNNKSIATAHFSTTGLLTRRFLTQEDIKKIIMSTDSTNIPKSIIPFSRDSLESLLKRRFFFAPSFEIYGGVSGLYDYGPPGCAFQANIVDAWRKHFILEEDMLEVDCSMLTPAEVLKTSGHVEKFADWLCRDLKTGEIFRADHLIEEVLESRLKGDSEARGVEHNIVETDDKKKRKKKVKNIKNIKLDDEVVKDYHSILAKIDNYSGPELGELMKQYKIVNPTTGGELETPHQFNLMFETAIGPSGQLKGYLRPETAQGQFLNFSRLYEFNNLKMPFASASIGKSFRNEISPKSGLLRVREFLMAEIEHYVDPENKSHPRFHEVSDTVLRFLPKEVQLSGKSEPVETTIGEAVKSKMVDNETLGYFIARIHHFLIKIGVDPTRLRFRQHMANEMAHYAADCWDAELQTSYGWIECVGCADRSAYDLSVHSIRTKEKLVVRQKVDKPIITELFEIELVRKKFGPKFRKQAPIVENYLLDLDQAKLESFGNDLKSNGKISFKVDGIDETIELDKEFISIEKKTKVEHNREYTPNVIEPSFGIGRILYSIFEHRYWVRPEDSDRHVLSLPPLVAPTKVLVVPLSNNNDLLASTQNLSKVLKKQSIPFKVDASSVSIGRRYARNDELGTPFGITVDFETAVDGSVTLRDRDTTSQVRGSVDDVIKAIKDITYEGVSWEEATKSLTPFTSKDEDE